MRLETLREELRKIEVRRTKLESQINKESNALYTSLPKKAGLKSVDALVEALLPLTTPGFQQKLSRPSAERESTRARPTGMSQAPAKQATAKKSAKRATTTKVVNKAAPAKAAPAKTASRRQGKQSGYSDSLKAAVRADMQEGKMTNKELSTKHKVPLETVKKWKRKWGLTAGAK